ncbi:DUF1398 domain-containing protein [Nitrospira sp. BLG_2]|uniref:DUF1398 domain-containing protein n=1 Tax=Nitrospira sp. BLG_2 TaxID=3397507 RepID=UPI003B9B37EB
MDADVVSSLAKTTVDGSMPFPRFVGKLIAEGVEYYHVDYAAHSFTFYSRAGSTVTAALPFEGLPSISDTFDATALKAAILDSQQHGQSFAHSVSVPFVQASRGILRFFVASGSFISVAKVINMLNGSPGRGRAMPKIELYAGRYLLSLFL